MKTAVITDSNSGIKKQEAKELGIFLIPMPVIIDGTVRYEETDLTQEEFYQSLTNGKSVTTSQPSPGDVMDLWDRVLAQGYDCLVYIPMSSGLSQSCHTALALSEDYGGKVQVVDNHRISVTMRESVLEAKQMAGQGASALEIKERLEASAYQSTIYLAVDTLEFLLKGGRITPAAAALGTVLNIKPILSIQGERLDAFAKVRGMKKSKKKIIEALKDDLSNRFHNPDMEKVRIGAAGSHLAEEEALDWKRTLEEAFPGAYVYYDPLSLSIACHTGPGAFGVGMSILS